MFFFSTRQTFNMLFWHYHKMHWRNRVNIVEGNNVIIFIHLGGRDFTCNDFTKNTVCTHLNPYAVLFLQAPKDLHAAPTHQAPAVDLSQHAPATLKYETINRQFHR